MNSKWNYQHIFDDISRIKNFLAVERNIELGNEYTYHSPELLPDFEKAERLLSCAINDLSHILIYGDYDADGITATIILYKFLSYLTPYVDFFIPDRLNDGYGISMEKARDIVDKGNVDIVITVDNGISAIEPVKYLADNGIKVIVTDHHTCLDVLPNAEAVINCHRSDSTYPFPDLCGAGVAFKLVNGLNEKWNTGYDRLSESRDLAALATIADIVPLYDENRALVSESLNKISKSKSVGIKAIIRCSEYLRAKPEISAEDIAFSVAPLINAASRMGKIEIALKLLSSEDLDDAMFLARQLYEINDERKQIEAQVTAEAMQIIINNKFYDEMTPIVIYKEGWHKGVIGITAARLAERFKCPVFIGTVEDGVIHGSARSYGGFNIFDALSACSDKLISFGGHPGAGGFKLDVNNSADFTDILAFYSLDNPWTVSDGKTAYAVIPIKGLSVEFIKDLNALEPFGEGNEIPVFISQNLRVTSIVAIGKDKNTLKMNVSDSSGNKLSCIGFSMPLYSWFIRPGDRVSIMYRLALNYYNGRASVQASLIDVQRTNTEDIGNDIEEETWKNAYSLHWMLARGQYECPSINAVDVPSDNEYKSLFPIIMSAAEQLSLKGNGVSIDILQKIAASTTNSDISIPKLLHILEVINVTHYKHIYVTSRGEVFFTDSSLSKTRVKDTLLYRLLKTYSI